MAIIKLAHKFEVKIGQDDVYKVFAIVSWHSKLCKDIVDTIIFVIIITLKLLLLVHIYYCCYYFYNYFGLEAWVGESQEKDWDHVR